MADLGPAARVDPGTGPASAGARPPQVGREVASGDGSGRTVRTVNRRTCLRPAQVERRGRTRGRSSGFAARTCADVVNSADRFQLPSTRTPSTRAQRPAARTPATSVSGAAVRTRAPRARGRPHPDRWTSQPVVDGGRRPGQGRRRRGVRRSRRRCSARATTRSAATVVLADPDGTPRPVRPRCAPWRRAPTAGGATVCRRPRRATGRSASRRGATRSRPGGTTPRSRSPPGIDVELDARGGRAAARARAPRACRRKARRTAARATPRTALPRPQAPGRRPGSPPRSTPDVVTRCWPPTRCASWSPRASRTRCGSSASGRSSAPGTSSSPAPRARSRPDGRRRRAPAPSRTAAERLPAIAAMGFDVVYLPPIHPIGRSHRKGPNNTLDRRAATTPARRGRSAPPRAATTPSTPTSARSTTSTRFVAAAARARPGGRARPRAAVLARPPVGRPSTRSGSPPAPTARIAYAENPPKKYQDIYPLNFDNDPDGHLRRGAARSCGSGSTTACAIFRVDNPHTKPVEFWEWLIAEVNATDPDVLFLAEAFTRPAMMHALGQGRLPAVLHLLHLAQQQVGARGVLHASCPATPAAYMRPNFFVNTPDILHEYLQYGGPPAFTIRAVLAATLSPTWGVYSGFELFEHVAVRPGSEEYLDSEKYEYRPRDWAARRGRGPHARAVPHPAQRDPPRAPRAAPAAQPPLPPHRQRRDHRLLQARRLARRATDTVVVVGNLDPHDTRETTVHLDMPALGLDWADRFASTTRSPARPGTGARPTTCGWTRGSSPRTSCTSGDDDRHPLGDPARRRDGRRAARPRPPPPGAHRACPRRRPQAGRGRARRWASSGRSRSAAR